MIFSGAMVVMKDTWIARKDMTDLDGCALEYAKQVIVPDDMCSYDYYY